MKTQCQRRWEGNGSFRTNHGGYRVPIGRYAGSGKVKGDLGRFRIENEEGAGQKSPIRGLMGNPRSQSGKCDVSYSIGWKCSNFRSVSKDHIFASLPHGISRSRYSVIGILVSTSTLPQRSSQPIRRAHHRKAPPGTGSLRS